MTRSLHWCVTVAVIAVLAAVTVVVFFQDADPVMTAYWCFGATVGVYCVVAFAIGGRYTKNPPAAGRVLCIVPAYNVNK